MKAKRLEPISKRRGDVATSARTFPWFGHALASVATGWKLVLGQCAVAWLVFCGPVWAADAELKWVDTSDKTPSDAVVIFDGEKTDLLVGPNGEPCTWEVRQGALICGVGKQKVQQGLWTRLHFRDAQIHAEFMIPETSKKGEDAGNSGLYIHGLFEQQILNSYQNKSRPISAVGAVYGIRPPAVNVARPPGTWQTYDVIYTAPRRNAQGEPTEEGSITTLLNGVLVQLNTKILRRKSTYTPLYFRTTPYAEQIRASLLSTECGPLQLQNHNSPVHFRNIWIRPLDDKSFVFKPQTEDK